MIQLKARHCIYLLWNYLKEKQIMNMYFSLNFKARNDSLTLLLQDNHYSIAIVSGHFSAYLTDKVKLIDGTGRANNEVFEDGMVRAFDNISKASDRVILILDVPELNKVKANCDVRVKSLDLTRNCVISVDDIKSARYTIFRNY